MHVHMARMRDAQRVNHAYQCSTIHMCLQTLEGLLGRCFTGQDRTTYKGVSSSFTFHICLNASGITQDNPFVITHNLGLYVGWDAQAQMFGFLGGSRCSDIASAPEGATRSAKVFVTCCPSTAVYVSLPGKLRARIPPCWRTNFHAWADAWLLYVLVGGEAPGGRACHACGAAPNWCVRGYLAVAQPGLLVGARRALGPTLAPGLPCVQPPAGR